MNNEARNTKHESTTIYVFQATRASPLSILGLQKLFLHAQAHEPIVIHEHYNTRYTTHADDFKPILNRQNYKDVCSEDSSLLVIT